MGSDRDQEAIRALQRAYGVTFDTRDADKFADLYTDDAVLVQIGGKEIRTRDKFVKAVRNMPPPGDGYHRMLETEIEIDRDEARGTCRFAARTSAGTTVTGHYEDRYRRTEKGWRISRRAVFLDAEGAVQ
jgi:uncharacterized protein (TIGR02246 family)